MKIHQCKFCNRNLTFNELFFKVSPINGFECPKCKKYNDVKFHSFIIKTWDKVLYIGINIPISTYFLTLLMTKDKDVSLISAIVISFLAFIIYYVFYFFTTKIKY